jgi:hypothetical protein
MPPRSIMDARWGDSYANEIDPSPMIGLLAGAKPRPKRKPTANADSEALWPSASDDSNR